MEGRNINAENSPEHCPEPEHLCHDLRFTPEQIALQALVDRIFIDADRRAFLFYNDIIEKDHHE